MTLANLVGTSLRKATFTDARLQGVNMVAIGPVQTDFSGADLTRAYLNFSKLIGCNFADAEMPGIDLTRCNVSGATLRGANLTGANLSNSDFQGADLSYAMLVGALLNDVDLRGANLGHSELTRATLSGVLMTEADLGHAHLSRTVLARCRDLHRAFGLDSLEYVNGVCVDVETLRFCLAGLPDDFLGNAGLEPHEIDALRGAAASVA
jgi:uncharacterized protein YjbI with pentapeptide repeats